MTRSARGASVASESDDSVAQDASSVLSTEYVRRVGKKANKFELDVKTVGIRYAIQQQREIGRLHTFHPGERAELDYTKFAIWLYPNSNWDEPQLFFVGFGVDHTAASGVIKGYTITAHPTAASGIRLYRNCVLPKRLWLPPHLQKYANDWDVAGVDRLVAIDNAMDIRSTDVASMFMAFGTIVQCMPPRRGDAKGTIERTQWTIETRHISMLPGYVKSKYKFTDPRTKRLIERAKKGAKLTVAEFEKMLLLAILDFNQSRHPTLKKPRIDVYRNGIDLAPIVLPTGLRQIRSTFALTYKGVRVTREGVRIQNFLQYNSPELNEFYRTSTARVDVKLDPDDIRAVLIYCRELNGPIEAFLTTYALPEPTTLEMVKAALCSDVEGAAPAHADDTPDERFLVRLLELQNSPGSRQGSRKDHVRTQATVQAATLPPVTPPTQRSMDDAEFESMFGGYEASVDG